MARCSSLEETEREIVAASVMEAGNMVGATPSRGGGGVPTAFDDEGHVSDGVSPVNLRMKVPPTMIIDGRIALGLPILEK
jgi:hypothetical protein